MNVDPITQAKLHRSDNNNPQRYTDEDILDAIRRVAWFNDGYCSYGIYREYYSLLPNIPSPALVTKRFDTWTEACKAAGVQSGRILRTYHRMGNDELADAVRFVSEQIGRLPSLRQYVNYRESHAEFSLPSQATLRNRLGGWAAILEAATNRPRSQHDNR